MYLKSFKSASLFFQTFKIIVGDMVLFDEGLKLFIDISCLCVFFFRLQWCHLVRGSARC
jgi:hypothetical protein